jgi:hypothetical protein
MTALRRDCIRASESSYTLETQVSADLRRRRKMRGKNLDRHDTIQAGVQATVHLSHSARTERRRDFIRTELGAGGKRHPWAQL